MTGLNTAAQLAALGLDPIQFLNCKDGFTQGLLIELGRKIHEYRTIEQENLAKRIAHEVSKLFRK